MAIPKQLPSGQWRTLAFSHYENVYDKNGDPVLDKDGNIKKKRIYESFTAESKKLSALAAAEFMVNKKKTNKCTKKLREATEEYIVLRTAVLSPSTIREYKRSNRCDLQNIKECKICDLSQENIQAEINREALTHSPKSVRNMHGLLSAVLRVYRPDFALSTDLPKKVRTKIYVPSDAQIQDLMAYVHGGEMEIPILLAAFGPMRRGEISALNMSSVDGNIVHVENNMVLNDGHEWVLKPPKSYSGDRYIDYPQFVTCKFPKGGRVTRLNPSQITDRFNDVLQRAGIDHFRFHDLRHYSASIQHALGIPDAYIMQRGGWGNDGTLKEVYRHAMSEEAKKMSQKANEHFEKMQHDIQHN